jgi:hypothetical protein
VALRTLTYNLMQLHRKVDEQIRAEMKRRVPDSLQLLRLKRLKLRVKDRLHALTVRQRTA